MYIGRIAPNWKNFETWPVCNRPWWTLELLTELIKLLWLDWVKLTHPCPHLFWLNGGVVDTTTLDPPFVIITFVSVPPYHRCQQPNGCHNHRCHYHGCHNHCCITIIIVIFYPLTAPIFPSQNWRTLCLKMVFKDVATLRNIVIEERSGSMPSSHQKKRKFGKRNTLSASTSPLLPAIFLYQWPASWSAIITFQDI